MFSLHGIVPPVVTPLHADESLNEEGLEVQLERLLAGGVHGIFFLGTTGEQPALRDSVRVQAVRAAKRVVAGRVPLIVGTMADSTARAIDNIRAAEAAGADGFAVTPPHYYPSRGPEDQLAHYQGCVEATRLPVVVYNIPSTTKVNLGAETMARIAEMDRVIGVKDSSGDFMLFLRLLSLLRGKEGCGLMVGSPPLLGPALLYGGDGGVPGTANIDPAALVAVYDAGKARDLDRLLLLQERVQALGAIANVGSPIGSIKTALELMGVCPAHVAAPLQPLSDAERETIRQMLQKLELL
jgi:4-hydroxy-tetrahydrodipicolinate synthase